MYKVLRSYTRKAERKHELTRSADHHLSQQQQHQYSTNGGAQQRSAAFDETRNGQQLVPVDGRRADLVWSATAGAVGQAFSESSSYEAREHFERKVHRVKKTRGERDSNRKLKKYKVSETLSSSVDGDVSARDALLQWAQDVTRGYPGVNVRNFSSSWRDGLAFNAILHRYRPNLINWSRISDDNVAARERLNNAFAAAENEFGVSRLLDAEDVDVESPDEKSIITYVSSLYNALPHSTEFAKTNLADVISRLTRGIGITNEKLDHILKRIEEAEARIETSRPSDLQRVIDIIIDDLASLEVPILGFFEDVELLRHNRHPETNDFYQQVYGLEQRRQSYLTRLRTQFMSRLGMRSQALIQEAEERRETIRRTTFTRVEECIQWVRERLEKLTEMEFVEDLEQLESVFEEHKLDNHDIQDFRQNVDECIARQAEVPAEDTHEYCKLLTILESEYQQLRDLSAGRMLDLDTLIAFIRGAQQEIVWINEREDIEVTRNWSDINQLDLPMLHNYYKQLLHEIELREPRFNDVHNKGAALLNQGHPAVHVIEYYLNGMQRKWDWLLSLSKCLEQHLRDANNLKTFMEDAAAAEDWMLKQADLLERKYNRSDFSLEEGEQLLYELDEINDLLKKYHGLLMTLTERTAQISPLWQRGERINRPIPIIALADYADNNITIREGDECTLLNNSDLIQWVVRGIDGVEATVPSVLFRVPPPDPHLTAYLNRLHSNFDKLRRLWEKKHRMVRLNMVLNTMAQIRGWDLETFMAINPDERDAIIKALNDDTQKLLAELDANDPLALRLREELRLTNEHFYDLLNQLNRPKEPDIGSRLDQSIADLLKKLDDAYRKLNERVVQNVPHSSNELERLIVEHKNFEDGLQALDIDVSTVKELFRQISNPTPSQRANHDHLNARWEDIWELSRMYVERLKALEGVLNNINEVTDIVRQHEITLNSFDDLPASLDRLRGAHAQLLEMNMVLQQQQSVIDSMNRNIALLRQHVSRTRQTANHPDVDRLEDEIQSLTVRWENVCSQVAERMKAAERALQLQMVYRSEYVNEIAWLDKVEKTLNNLRRPEDLHPEEYQQQLDQLIADYAHLQERTEAIENVNREGGKFIREAKGYDSRLLQYLENILLTHGPAIRTEFRRTQPQPKNGAQQVTEELELLNRRFAQLSSLILERRNTMQVLIQNWKRKKQNEMLEECVHQQNYIANVLETLNGITSAVSQRFSFVATSDEASSAHSRMQDVREQLLSWSSKIGESIIEADRLCEEGADYLTPEQFHTLKEHRNRLEKTFNQLVRHTDTILERLNDLTRLLLEFTNDSSLLHSYVNEKNRHIAAIKAESGDFHYMSDYREKAKNLIEEVLANEVRLKDILSLSTTIQKQLDAYVVEMRVQFPEQQFQSIDAHEISSTLSRLQNDYAMLIRECHDLNAYLNKLNSLASNHKEIIEQSADSISQFERRISMIENDLKIEEASSENTSVLNDLENLQHLSLNQATLIEQVCRSATQLDSALVGTDARDRIVLENQREIDDLSRRENRAKERVEEMVDSWRSKVAKSDGLKESVGEMIKWLEGEERKFMTSLRLPLLADKLNEVRRDEEVNQRELISREKVFAELAEEIAKSTSLGSNGAYKSLDGQVREAAKKFESLIILSKARTANVKELLEKLNQVADSEKLVNEKLLALSYIRPTDMNSVTLLEEEINNLIETDWKMFQEHCKWIFSMDGVVDVGPLTHSMSRLEHLIEKQRMRCNEQSEQCRALDENRNNLMELRMKAIEWLDSAESNIKELEKISLDPVELEKQRSICAKFLNDHQQQRHIFEKLTDLGSKLADSELIFGIKKSSIDGQNTVRDLSTLVQRYESLGILLKNRAEKINLTSEKFCDWDLSRDELSRWIYMEIKRLENECPIALTNDNIASNSSKTDHLEKVHLKEKQTNLEKIRAKAHNLLTDISLKDLENVVRQQEVLEREWMNLLNLIGTIKERINSSKSLIQGCENMDKWIKQKEKMVSIMGAINIDPKVIDCQLLQLDVLQGEMDDQNTQRTKINEIAHELVTNASNDPNCKYLIEKMDSLNLRWIPLQDNLNSTKENLLKVKEASLQFSSLHRNTRLDLLKISEELEEANRLSFTDPNEFNSYMNSLDGLAKRVNQAEDSLASLKKLAETVEETAGDNVSSSDVREQLNSVSLMTKELDRKIGSLKNAAVNSKAEEGAAVSEAQKYIKLMKGHAANLEEIGPLSADSQHLAEQSRLIDAIYQDVLDKEGDVALIRAKIGEQLKRAPNGDLKEISDLFATEWNPLLSNVKQKKASADRVVDLVNQLNSSLSSFNAKLQKNQEIIASFSDEDSHLAEMKEREKLIESQVHEINALEALVQKLETVACGPSINKLNREMENSHEDWKLLLKDLKNMINKNQQKKDLRGRLEKCKESMENSLKMARETARKLEEDRDANKLVKDSLKKAITDLENNRQWMNSDFNSVLKELQLSGDCSKDEMVSYENLLADFNSEFSAIISNINGLYGEIERKDELSENFKKDLQKLTADYRKKLNIELKPIARDDKNLAEQKLQCANLVDEHDENEKMVDSLKGKWKDLCENGSITGMEIAIISGQLDALKEDISKQRALLVHRKRNISGMEQALLNNEHDVNTLCTDINDQLSDKLLSEPLKAELNDLRYQQEKLRTFREQIRPVGQQVDRILESCTNLTKSADADTNVDLLDARKNSVVEAWNKLNSLVENREKQICMAMQELGGYTDTYNSLLVWLQDTEESLANQRAPSIEHKVVKEQSRANDILLKHIEEKQQSVNGFKEMIRKVEMLSADDSQHQNLQKKCNDIETRYSTLLKNAYIRRDRVHEALGLTASWSQAITPLKVWLKGAEWSLQQLAKVPTDEERMRQQIDAQNDLVEEIERKRPEFDLISKLYPQLVSLTSTEEAAELEETARTLLSSYDIISARVNECGELLHQMAEEIGNFFENANALSEWLDRIEEDIDKLGNISIYPEELIEQSSLLTALATSVTEHENLVSSVVDDGRELCRQTTGDEAIALQSHIEILRARYMELASITDSKIAVLAEALPLSERFHDGCEILQQWMDAVEQDLHDIDQVPLEAQSALITQMEEDLSKWRLDVDEINSISKHLHRLTTGPRADELEAQTEDLSRRFTQLAEQVTRKAEKLMSVEKQSRQVLDELDYLNEWFSDAKNRLAKASAPAVDPDYVKKQLKNQKQMNEDIAIMKARLRDAIADAQKLSRALGDETGGQESLLASKIDSGRSLSLDVTKIGEERLGELEQALALCQEVDHSFGDLHIWLEKMEDEIDNCPAISTGNRRDHLLKQQIHNTELQQSIQAQKPLLDRFIRNVNALKELCDGDDGAQLEKIAEGIEERFEAIKETVMQRGEALETAIAHSSQFCDRLDMILTSLSGIAAQVRNVEPVSADPERIRAQILENSCFIEELRHKEQSLFSIKENASNLLGHIKPDDPSNKDIAIKLENLDNLWEELNRTLESRSNLLEEVLLNAENFWMELELCRKTSDEFRKTIEEIQPAIGQPQALEQQRITLLAIEDQLSKIRPQLMDNLHKTGLELCNKLANEELAHVERQLNDVENSWATITNAFSRKNADIMEAFEKAAQFQTLLSDLAKWLDHSEAKVAALMPMSGLSSSDIRNELNVLSDLRASLDEKAIQKEQLNHLSANLCANATGNQTTLIRAPVNDLNSRWNRLYASLNERQQKIERALLEMGQFSQAYDQLTKWMEKTKNTLDEIDSCPTSLKQIEIEVCKHKVVQNDVLAHEGSIDTLNTAAKRIIANDPNSASVTQPMIDDLNAHWHTLVDKLEDVWEQLNQARKAAENLGGEVDKWALWLQDKDADLSHAKPSGGLPETARAQLDDFLVLKAEIEQNRADLESHLEMAEKYLSENTTNSDTWIAQRETQLKKRWAQVQEKMVNREQKLRMAVTDAEQLNSMMTEMNVWLGQAENRLGRMEPVSRIPETLELQIADHSAFQAEVAVHRELMTDVHSKGTKLQYYCEKKDAIPIKNLLVSAKHRFDKIVSRSADRGKQLDVAQQEAQLFFDSHAELMKWIESSAKWIDNQTVQTSSADRLREVLERHKEFQRELVSHQSAFDNAMKRGKLLSEHAPRGEQVIIDPYVEELRQSWTQLCTSSLLRQRDIEEALIASGQFDEALSSLREWLEKQLPILKETESQPIRGDFETISRLVEEHNNLKEQIESHRTTLQTVRQRAEQILSQGKEDDSLEGLKEKLEQLNENWTQLESLAKLKDDRLKEALKEAEDFSNQMHSILEWLPRAEARLRLKNSISDGENEILEQMDEVAQVRKEFDDREEKMQSLIVSGKEMLANCHPEAEQPMKCCLKILETRWNEVSQLIDNKRDDLERRLNELREQERLICELLKFIAIKDSELKNLNSGPLPENIDALMRLMSDHEEFENSLRARQPEVDDATKSRRRTTDEENHTKAVGKTPSKRQRSLRHPKCDQLSDRWKKLWIDSMEYGRRLREMKEYLDEVKKLESFSFEEWRERYLEWTDSGKARISDLFRRIDKSGTGRVPRAAFIDGIIASKFPTSRLEMEKVADEFDKGDGMIDAKEFMSRLRFDYAKKLPLKQKTDGEKINEEVMRQSEKCNCHTPYKIQKVSEGHYRFGDTQIKRMVRILRSTVMVRVGGGWVALEEFLHKHDPCRTRGRTNIDIQRGFYDDVRPQGAYDTMETFTKSSRSTPNRDLPLSSFTDSLFATRYSSTPGPITKIREKTERSMPMFSLRKTPNTSRISPSATHRSSRRPSDAQDSKIARPSTPVRSGSYMDNLDSSRPESRCSDISESTERPTRIPSLRGKKGAGYRPSGTRDGAINHS